MLVGDRAGRLIDAIEVPNTAANPRSGFQIDPLAWLAVVRRLRCDAPLLRIAGFFHSHPNGPLTPSAADLRQAPWPDLEAGWRMIASPRGDWALYAASGGFWRLRASGVHLPQTSEACP